MKQITQNHQKAFLSGQPLQNNSWAGRLAWLGHLPDTQKAVGSSPTRPTKKYARHKVQISDLHPHWRDENAHRNYRHRKVCSTQRACSLLCHKKTSKNGEVETPHSEAPLHIKSRPNKSRGNPKKVTLRDPRGIAILHEIRIVFVSVSLSEAS